MASANGFEPIIRSFDQDDTYPTPYLGAETKELVLPPGVEPGTRPLMRRRLCQLRYGSIKNRGCTQAFAQPCQTFRYYGPDRKHIQDRLPGRVSQ